jgi:hypothetical protein
MSKKNHVHSKGSKAGMGNRISKVRQTDITVRASSGSTYIHSARLG